jgi:DNA-binding NtrC family response regulator
MGKRILLVEDEMVLRSLVTSVLEAAGHSVETKESAEDVLTLLDQGDFPFDAVVTDLQLVSMNGAELAGIIHSKFPEVRLLLTTGYGSDVTEAFPILPKPFRPADLLKAVDSLFPQ